MWLWLLVVLALGCTKDEEAQCGCLHGKCVDGVCVCDEGWIGWQCDTKLPPYRALSIDSVRLWRYPIAKRDGKPWDSPPLWDGDPEPEVFISIVQYTTGETLWESLTAKGNKDTLTLLPPPNAYISRGAATETFFLRVLDKDQGSSPDEMAVSSSFNFYPTLTGEGTQSTTTILCGDSTMVQLYFSYVWN